MLPARPVLLLTGAVLAGCASMPDIPKPPPPKKLVLEQALTGRLLAEGAFVNSLTGGETRLNVLIDGTWEGQVLTLVEDFTYDGGLTERKTWRLTKTAEGIYSGTREDVIGAADVRQDGDGVRLDYRVTLDTGLGPIAVRFQDLLTLNADGSVENAAVVSKWGLKIGRVHLTMRPQKR
ncbi:MAG: DUF3833 family protein [Alphaproteobacteria bacterium]|nr:DUF3833 family protein [Alphaproteobacteria bacterium]